MGHSYGGSVALRLAVNDKHKLRSLTLIEPNAHSIYLGSGEDPKTALVGLASERFLTLVNAGKPEIALQEFMDDYAAGTWDAMSAEVKSQFLDNIDNFVSGMLCNLSEPTTPEDCRSIMLPSLLMYGDKSQPYYSKVAEVLVDLLPAAYIEVLPGAEHMSPFTHSELIASKLAVHLEAVKNSS